MTSKTRSIQVRKFAIIAVSCFAFATLPALGKSSGQNTATKEFQKTLTLGANQTVSMEHKFGDVRFHGENGRDVKISATIRVQAHSQADADKFADQVRIEVSQDSQGVKIRTVYPDQESGFFKIRIGGPSYSVDYDIAVPNDAKLWLKNNFGNAEIAGVHGWTDVENGHGKLTFRDGGSAKLTNSFGAVEANGADGGVTIVNNNGSVTVSSVKGALDVKDRFASITVSNIQGAVTISGGNGAVELTDAGAAKVNNSFGSVNARNIHGDLVVNNNNGTIEVNTVSGGAQLTTSFGSITFADVAGSVRCTSSNGRVHGGPSGNEVYVKTTFGEVSLERINGPVEVEDSNGGITVREIKGKGTFNTSFGSIEAAGLPKGVHATTGNGRINLTDVGGDAYAKTSFGSINVQRVNGNLTIENSNGPVSANAVKGDATAKTSFGAITLDDIGGSLSVDNQNGAVIVSAARTSPGCKNITLKTSFSPMQVRLPAEAGYDVNARTSFGHINSELPVTATGVISGDSLNGKIGNGGCTLSLTNSNGNIEIQKLTK
jgi:hypothetical protein